MSILLGICVVLAVLCLIYYGIIIIYAGVGTAFAWFWLCSGLGLLIFSTVIHYVTKREIKIPEHLKILLITLVSLGICLFLFIEGTVVYHSAQKAEPGADYMIVLGAQVRGTIVSKSLKKRLDTAIVYLQDNPKTTVIVSGGQGTGEDISEAEAMERYLISKGIAKERIIQENQSTNTVENIRFSMQMIENSHPRVAIVTNGFHIFRSLSIAKKQGLKEVQGLAAPSDRILVLNYYIREAAGVLKDFIFGNI